MPSEPTAAINPLDWAREQATIVHPQRGRIPFVPYPYQRKFLEDTNPRRLVLKARQIGFSQVFALEALHTAIYEPESTILLVSRSQDLAVNLLRYCYQTYNNLKNPPDLIKENESEIGLANGSRIKSIPANRSTGRGFAATAVYLDEFAYAAYADDIYQSVSPAVSQGGRLTIGSTPNGPANLFATLWHGGESFSRHYAPWFHCPPYNPAGYNIPDPAASRAMGEQGAWYRDNHHKYTLQAWAAEFDCDFSGSGDGLFNVTDLDRAEEGAWGEQMVPVPGHEYVTAVDVGRRRDATIINTVDITATPYQRVAFDRLEGVPYPRIQQVIEERQRRYGGTLVIESNGVGDPLMENLTVSAAPFVTTARSKVQAIQALQLLLEQGDFKARWDTRERAALASATWSDDHTADEIMSLAIFAASAGSWITGDI